jgi:hypothetical protein
MRRGDEGDKRKRKMRIVEKGRDKKRITLVRIKNM